jgi:hypothetical protein
MPGRNAAAPPSRDGENADDPEASAEVMKARFTEMDAAANDPGPIPEFLIRAPKAAPEAT